MKAMKEKISLLVIAFAMLVLLILFKHFFYIDGFSEWFLRFPIIPLAYSLMSLFIDERSSYHITIATTILMLFSDIVLCSALDIMTLYKVLSILAGCSTALLIAHYTKKHRSYL